MNAQTPFVTRDQAILQWLDTSKQLKALAAKEKEQRIALAAGLFPNNTEGTNTCDLGNGYKIKAIFGFNYSLPKGDATEDMLAEFERNGGPNAPFISERLVTFDPKLSVTEYKKLTDRQRTIVDKVLKITPSLVTIEMVEPPKS